MNYELIFMRACLVVSILCGKHQSSPVCLVSCVNGCAILEQEVGNLLVIL